LGHPAIARSIPLRLGVDRLIFDRRTQCNKEVIDTVKGFGIR
jgi:hypothetical protein